MPQSAQASPMRSESVDRFCFLCPRSPPLRPSDVLLSLRFPWFDPFLSVFYEPFFSCVLKKLQTFLSTAESTRAFVVSGSWTFGLVWASKRRIMTSSSRFKKHLAPGEAITFAMPATSSDSLSWRTIGHIALTISL